MMIIPNTWRLPPSLGIHSADLLLVLRMSYVVICFPAQRFISDPQAQISNDHAWVMARLTHCGVHVSGVGDGFSTEFCTAFPQYFLLRYPCKVSFLLPACPDALSLSEALFVIADVHDTKHNWNASPPVAKI